MNEYYYFFILFLSLISNCSANSLRLSSNVTIQHVCENDLLVLQCSNMNETIQIIRAMYGRTSQRICNQNLIHRFFEKTCANIEQSKYQTTFHCHGKSTCQILISNRLLTDPCGPTIPKHFEVHYRCINREEICPKLFLNCSKSKDIKCIEKIQEEFSCPCPPTICQYVNQQIIGFIENSCPEEKLQGFHWPKTIINQSRRLPCPSPCIGKLSRVCHSNSQWSTTNYTHCQCPIDASDQLSTHRSASSYVFQCNFWLINRILPRENSCIRSFTNGKMKENEGVMSCLVDAFQQMRFEECSPFGIDFRNLAFEIYVPMQNESRFDLLSDQIIVDRTDLIRENFRANLPMLAIDPKLSSFENHSILLVEEENDFNSLQTANVTIVFHPQSREIRYQCQAYHSTNFSLNLNSSNMFFACQLLCSNGSHVICQCPFFNPFMHYVLQIDRSKMEVEVMIDNDLNGRCSEETKMTMEKKINRYLMEISTLNFGKKVLMLIDRSIKRESRFSNWKIMNEIKHLASRLMDMTNSFISRNDHIELYIKSNRDQLENDDRSVLISILPKDRKFSHFQVLFFTLTNLNTSQLFNSRLVHVNLLPNNLSIDQIEITFRHLNNTNQLFSCVHLKDQAQWTTDGCELFSRNFTHSICSCQHPSTFALLINFPKSAIISNEKRLLFIFKTGCTISFVCISFTILLFLIMRSPMTMSDDLTTVRNILHSNMFFCLILVQLLVLFGIDQPKNKTNCRMISILLDYFLLATFSWMFVDGMELFIALKRIFKIDRIRLLAYSIYSYGFPLLIVLLSMTLAGKNGNGLSQYCWLSHDNAFIWAFAVPFLLLIVGNLAFFLLSMCERSYSTEHLNKLRCSLRDVSLISILFGLTWLIALFYLYDQTILLASLFTLLNSMHGVLILIFYCILEIHLRDLVGKLYSYKQQCLLFFDCWTKKNTNPNHLKSLEGFSLPDNTSSSGYSSGHSTDLHHKQILCNQTVDLHAKYTNHLSQPILFHNHYDRRTSRHIEASYLPSIPINLLTNRLSTFQYPLPANEVLLSAEQKEDLLRKNPSQDDEHQYYEIG